MMRYVLRRLLLAVPTLLIISLVAFGLIRIAPYDPVRSVLGEDLGAGLDPVAMGNAYREKARQLQLDAPAFYVSVVPAVLPDTLHRIYPPERRERMKAMALHGADWGLAQEFDRGLSEAVRALERLADSLPEKAALRADLRDLILSADPATVDTLLRRISAKTADAGLLSAVDTLTALRVRLQAPRSRTSVWLPALHWHGTGNLYHRWLTGFFTGQLGLTIYGKPVWEELRPRLYTTLAVNGLAILLAFLIALPAGVFMARRAGTPADTYLGWVLLFLYAIPVFWLGSMLIYAFATPEVGLFWIRGTYMDVWNPDATGFGRYLLRNGSKVVLPVLTLCVHLLALLALQMRGSMLHVLEQDYIRTARAKGLKEGAVYWRHAFRNALFPIIALFAGVFPAAFAGSLVIEYLFQFPGMGMKTQEAFAHRDYPVLFTILMLAAAVTVFAGLLGDLLYAWADPRVRFARK